MSKASDQGFRRTYIGGSDAAPIMGVGLWGSPYSVWSEKIGEGPEKAPASERMQWGLLLEGAVAQEWARREGATSLRKAVFRRHPELPYVGGHPDFTAVHPRDGKVLIETKLSDRVAQWEAEDGDSVPLQYYLQVQHYLLVTGIPVGYLVVLIRGNELRSWRLPADPAIHAAMIEAYRDFWPLVETRTEPEADGHEATAEALKHRYPQSEDEEMVAEVAEQSWVQELIAARKAEAEAVEMKTLAENRLKARMGTATKMIAPGVEISWRTSKDRTVVNWEQIALAYRSAVAGAASMEAGGDDGRWLSGRVLSDDLLDQLALVEAVNTNTIAGARPFRVTIKKEE